MEVEDNRIVIQALGRPREGWEEAFASMAERGDDRLLDADSSESEWDAKEWRWE